MAFTKYLIVALSAAAAVTGKYHPSQEALAPVTGGHPLLT